MFLDLFWPETHMGHGYRYQQVWMQVFLKNTRVTHNIPYRLSLIRFQIMNMVNKLTGYSPFQLCFGHNPHVLPPLTSSPPNLSKEYIAACEVCWAAKLAQGSCLPHLKLTFVVHRGASVGLGCYRSDINLNHSLVAQQLVLNKYLIYY